MTAAPVITDDTSTLPILEIDWCHALKGGVPGVTWCGMPPSGVPHYAPGDRFCHGCGRRKCPDCYALETM